MKERLLDIPERAGDGACRRGGSVGRIHHRDHRVPYALPIYRADQRDGGGPEPTSQQLLSVQQFIGLRLRFGPMLDSFHKSLRTSAPRMESSTPPFTLPDLPPTR